MKNGLFNLENFDNMADDDIMTMNINEEAEFANHDPDTNRPEDHFEPDATSNKPANVSVPGGLKEAPNAKPADAHEVPVPGGLSETPSAKPHDAASVSIPSKVTLTADDYNKALARLKQSFKEGVEILEMLESVDVVDMTIEEQQNEFVETAILQAMESGPIFEAVKRDDKENVKKIVNDIRNDIYKDIKADGYKVYKPSKVASVFINLDRTIGQIWSTRLWQNLGVVLCERANIDDLTKRLTEKYSEQLDGYKIIAIRCNDSIVDVFRNKFNWKNVKHAYFLVVDKKVPSELKKLANANPEKSEDKKDEKEDK